MVLDSFIPRFVDMKIQRVYTVHIRYEQLEALMKIILSNNEKIPFYEQLEIQIRNNILDGRLKKESKLPSIRSFARELGISVVTVKRAYDNLESEGYIHTVGGKGSYVAGQGLARLKEKKIQLAEEQLQLVLNEMQKLGVTKQSLLLTISLLWEEGE